MVYKRSFDIHATCMDLIGVTLRDPFTFRVPLIFLSYKSGSIRVPIISVTFFLDRTDLWLVAELAGVAVLLADASEG